MLVWLCVRVKCRSCPKGPELAGQDAIHTKARMMVSLTATPHAAIRVDWVDYAKGICIILVVMMHSTLGVEKAMGQASLLGHFVEWARPFRMPDFFLLSGLFLARRINVPWKSYADTKIVHFAYFYILWMSIQMLLKGYGIYQQQGLGGLAAAYALSFVEPFGTLWFIYLLPIFFAVTKLVQRVPHILIFAAAALLEILPIHTGYILIDEFASRYVYFFAGYWLAEQIFASAGRIGKTNVAAVVLGLVAWVAVHSVMVWNGWSDAPVISLVLGMVGAGAVITCGVLLSKIPLASVIRYLGENSIVIYLAFFLFMAISRTVLLRFAPGLGVDVIAAVVTASGVIGPVILHLLVKPTPLKYLFVRHPLAKVETWTKGWHSAKHDASAKPSEKFSQPQTRRSPLPD
jgi:uncharacterized membrane protein YcfT